MSQVIRSAAGILCPITTGELRGWRGLPSDLMLAEVTSVFPRDSDWSGSSRLGRRHQEANYLWVDIPGPNSKLRVWYKDDRVILLDLECSGIQAHPHELTSLFTEVPVPLDTWYGTLTMPESELVFPEHGLAAFINRETESIWHLALFPTLSLETYLDDLRINMETRRYPPLRK